MPRMTKIVTGVGIAGALMIAMALIMRELEVPPSEPSTTIASAPPAPMVPLPPVAEAEPSPSPPEPPTSPPETVAVAPAPETTAAAPPLETATAAPPPETSAVTPSPETAAVTASREPGAATLPAMPGTPARRPKPLTPSGDSPVLALPPETAAVPTAAGAALPALPVQEVKPRAPHMVADDQPLPVPHVTIQDRQGRVLSRPASTQSAMAPPGPRAQTALPSLAPAAGPQRMPQPQGSLQPIPATLTGPAHATGTVSIALDGHQVRLFGVQPPSTADRCTLGRGGVVPCSEVTQEVLASRVARSPSVTCRVPSGLSESIPARVCLDAGGADIAGYLVAEGLALADRNSSADYVGAEGIAQSYSKGLWHYR